MMFDIFFVSVLLPYKSKYICCWCVVLIHNGLILIPASPIPSPNPFQCILDISARLLYLGAWTVVSPIILRVGWSVE